MSTSKPLDVFSAWIHVYRQAQKGCIELQITQKGMYLSLEFSCGVGMKLSSHAKWNIQQFRIQKEKVYKKVQS